MRVLEQAGEAIIVVVAYPPLSCSFTQVGSDIVDTRSNWMHQYIRFLSSQWNSDSFFKNSI
ncbi:hypothetical protein ACS0TY_008260 [Phlomoides rotata]